MMSKWAAMLLLEFAFAGGFHAGQGTVTPVHLCKCSTVCVCRKVGRHTMEEKDGGRE